MQVLVVEWTDTITVLQHDKRVEECKAKSSDYEIRKCLHTKLLQLQQRKTAKSIPLEKGTIHIERNVNDRHSLNACLTNLFTHVTIEILCYHI